MARHRINHASTHWTHCVCLFLILIPGGLRARPCESGADGCVSRGSAFAPADSGGWTGGYAPENGAAPPVGPSGGFSSNGSGGGGIHSDSASPPPQKDDKKSEEKKNICYVCIDIKVDWRGDGKFNSPGSDNGSDNKLELPDEAPEKVGKGGKSSQID